MRPTHHLSSTTLMWLVLHLLFLRWSPVAAEFAGVGKNLACAIKIKPLQQFYYPYSTIVVRVSYAKCNEMPGKNEFGYQICAQRSCVDVPVPATQRSEGHINIERHRFLAEYVQNRTIATDFVHALQAVKIAYGNSFPIGFNRFKLSLYNKDKSILYGEGHVAFTIRNVSSFISSEHNPVRVYEIQKGERIDKVIERYCHSVVAEDEIKSCYEVLFSNTMHDFDKRGCESDTGNRGACQLQGRSMYQDMASLYNFQSTILVPQTVNVDNADGVVNVDMTSRESICSSFRHFCRNNGLGSNICYMLSVQYFNKMPYDLAKQFIYDPYLAHYDPIHFYTSYGTDTEMETRENDQSLEILFLILKEEREEYRNDSPGEGLWWGKNEDIIYFQRQNLFKTLRSLFDDKSNENFRPCANWVMIAAEDTHVNKTNLFELLSTMDSTVPHYVGYGETVNGTQAKLCSQTLTSNFIPFDIPFASFSGGILLSRGLLYILQQRILSYVRPLLMGYDRLRSYCYDLSINDARLGGCIKYQLGISLTDDVRFGSMKAPTCDRMTSGEWDVSDQGDTYITLRHVSPGQNCKQQRNIQKTSDMMQDIVVGITTYEKDRDNAIDQIKHILESSTYTLTKGVTYSFPSENILIYDGYNQELNSNDTITNKYPKRIQLRPSPPCQSEMEGWHCVQEKMIAAIFDMSYWILMKPNIKFAIFGDCDQSYNMLDIAEKFTTIDYEKPLMLGDLWKGHSDIPYISGGGLFFTRSWMEKFYTYVIDFYSYHGQLPLSGKTHSRRSYNGIHGCDSFITYITTTHLGGELIDVPGIFGYNAFCLLPKGFLVEPVLSVHGLWSTQKKNKSDETLQMNSNYFPFSDKYYAISEIFRTGSSSHNHSRKLP